MSEWLVRAASARVFERGSALFVLSPTGAVHRLEGDSAALARAVLSLLEIERTRDELFAALAELVGGPVEPASVVDELVALLRHAGAVHAAREEAPARGAQGRRGLRVVLGVTGAVQAVHTPWLASLLLAEGHDVRVVMTENALRFCRAEGLEALTHNAVVSSLWALEASAPAPHIRLAEWADLVVIAPASASAIARIAGGSCEEIVSAVAIATRAPVVLAPSMNVAMSDAPSVVRNVEALREDGFIIVHPTTGHEVALAPTERRAMRGTMPPPPEFISILRAILGTNPARRERAATLSASWDERYAQPSASRPWEASALDDGFEATMTRLLASAPSPARALDLGCGTGLVAAHLASRGCSVTAVDIAPRAIALGRARTAAERVLWIEGDALSLTFSTRFDFVCDRALLHVLPASVQRAYAQRAAAMLASSGALVLTAHSEAAPVELGTTRFSVRAMAALFDGLLELESVEPTVMRGPAGEGVSARRYVWRKLG